MDKEKIGSIILKGNLLIAEFMGSTVHNGNITKLDEKENIICGNGSMLDYHCSWDCLMPVVEKIEDLDMSSYHYQWKDLGFMQRCR